MRPLLLNSTFFAMLAGFIVSLIWALRAIDGSARAACHGIRKLSSSRCVLVFLLVGAFVNLSLRALSGYINPRDYAQDVIAARQVLKGETLYPDDVPQRGLAELASSMPGERLLRRIPLIQGEFGHLTEPPASVNAHPPLIGIVLALPVWLCGFRGSFLGLFALFGFLVWVSVVAIVRELFGPPERTALICLAGLIFGWYAVGDSLRAAQPSSVILWLITIAWLSLRRQRQLWAGVAIGIAASLHAFPAFLLAYCALRYRRALASALVTIALVGAVVVVVTGPTTFSEWLHSVNFVSKAFVPVRGNVSLAGMVAGFALGMGWNCNQTLVSVGVIAIVTALLAVLLWPGDRRQPAKERLDIEYSMFVAAMLLVSPVVWGRYLLVLLLPIAVLVKNWRYREERWLVPALLGSLAILAVPTQPVEVLYDVLHQKIGFAASWVVTSAINVSLIVIFAWTAGLRKCQPRAEGLSPRELEVRD